MSVLSSTRPNPLDVSIIIVNYNVRAFLQQALHSVKRSIGTLSAEIIVVDNHSVDGSCAMVRREFPDVHLIANSENVGFAKANNQGIQCAKGRYLLILNPDTIVAEDTLSTLVAFLDTHPTAGAVGCQILNPDGSFAPESRRAFPTPATAFFRMIGLSRLFPRSRLIGRYNLGYLPRDRVAEIDALSGSCMMVRKAAISYSEAAYGALNPTEQRGAAEIFPGDVINPDGAGIFDEGFFMYGEDLDWCYRIQQVGWKIFYTPDTSIIHYKGESTRKNQLRYVRLFYGAMIRFAEKHLSHRYPPIFLWLLRVAVVGRGCLSALVQAGRHRATRDGILMFVVMAALGLLRSLQMGVEFPGMFYWLIAPAFALITVSMIGILGGYQSTGRRLGSVVAGVSFAVLLLSAASFFVKTIAFSRAVVLASLPASILALAALRMKQVPVGTTSRRTLFVGDAREVQRLQEAQRTLEVPPYAVVGYVPTNAHPSDPIGIPILTPLESLRELVQAHEIQVVVFASASLSNKAIFTLTRRLGGLSVETRILAHNHAHVIGKASVDLLQGAALLETQEALGYMRSRMAHRLFDVAMAILGALVHPLVLIASRLGSAKAFWRVLGERTRQWPDVLTGQSALVGFRKRDRFVPPKEWGLRPGVFAVTDSMGPRGSGKAYDTEQVYWSYVRRQSAWVDWLIVVRAVRLLRQ